MPVSRLGGAGGFEGAARIPPRWTGGSACPTKALQTASRLLGRLTLGSKKVDQAAWRHSQNSRDRLFFIRVHLCVSVANSAFSFYPNPNKRRISHRYTQMNTD